jgi:hypothetical protein
MVASGGDMSSTGATLAERLRLDARDQAEAVMR